ncbi:MAG: TIGR04255 family protein [Acidobacteria bacterium]|nr:TIGR04255 family protein [Acidobacteriota bacterium]
MEIRWKLQPLGNQAVLTDPNFAFALGVFYNTIKDRFGLREDLEAANAPAELLPYIVRHRFRPSTGSWPIIQIGPGVATVNFTEPYTWHDFKQLSLYLRSNLIEAYGDARVELEQVTLRYRNIEELDTESSSLLDFLKKKLNVPVVLPAYNLGWTPLSRHKNGAS